MFDLIDQYSRVWFSVLRGFAYCLITLVWLVLDTLVELFESKWLLSNLLLQCFFSFQFIMLCVAQVYRWTDIVWTSLKNSAGSSVISSATPLPPFFFYVKVENGRVRVIFAYELQAIWRSSSSPWKLYPFDKQERDECWVYSLVLWV